MVESTDEHDEAYVVTLGTSGQIAIPRFMRKEVKAGERFLIVRVGNGYYLKPVSSLGLRAMLEDVRDSLSKATKASGLHVRDVERLVVDVRKHHRLHSQV